MRTPGNLVTRLVPLLLLLALPTDAAAPKRLPGNLLKSGVAVRSVFRPIVAEARRATVIVRADGKEVALGVIVASDGWVLTKASELADKTSCVVGGDTAYPARVAGVHPGYDLALLKLPARQLPVINWKTDGDPDIGQWLATPGPDETPVAIGIVSGRRRAIRHRPGILGIRFPREGGPISEVVKGSGAEKAGLKKNDLIIRVAGQSVSTGNSLSRSIQRFRPGNLVELRVRRGSVDFDVAARLTGGAVLPTNRSARMNRLGGSLSSRRGGFPNVFAHDTVLKPNQCGGPVVDLTGQAVGLNIARAGRTESQAIPAAIVLRVLLELRGGRWPVATSSLGSEDSPPPPPASRHQPPGS